MSNLDRRDILSGLAAAGTLLWTAQAQAEEPQKKGTAPPGPQGKDAVPALLPEMKGLVQCTEACVTTGKVCLARCTNHLAAGMTNMADCQRGVMNMLVVTEAMATVAAYRSADVKSIAVLAQACATFCRACEKGCEPHAKAHEECKACADACRACIKCCDQLVG